MKRSLLYNQNKPCLQPKEALFANHCCPVKKLLAAGSAKRDLYAKPTASREAAQLWVDKDARHGSPKGDLCHWLSAGCVSPASRNIILSYSYTHSCAASRLAVGFA